MKKVGAPYLKEVTVNSLNIRKGPSTSFEVIGAVEKGVKLEVLAEKGAWTKVKTAKSQGWVSARYLK